jgi:hypothetical protein
MARQPGLVAFSGPALSINERKNGHFLQQNLKKKWPPQRWQMAFFKDLQSRFTKTAVYRDFQILAVLNARSN